MATGHVWGIDIGQCGLKALRGRLADDGQAVVAESFDFIEYPQILSQPDANPEELVREALKKFLSRNSLRGDKVAISLSGQSGLARFIKLPPVDSKQLPSLVGFEAKQQIPFALEDVVWDYQRIPGQAGDGGDEDDDLPLETEVGLFAMKRDQVLRSIRPLMDAEVELDIIQLTPICVYNAVGFDHLKSDEGFDSEKSHRWTVVLSMGTDTSDLVVTNGFRVWQRSVPIGGGHFTKQLTKDLKLTFAKAEHVKRNARQAEDAKRIFQAMRPVFNDLVTEVQRSIGYFSSLERDADVESLVILGNAAKLPGLPQYLEKNLGISVLKLSEYERLSGPGVSDDATFKENVLAFAVSYGLVLQGLGKGQLRTNLVPPEIVRARLIRRKKPWAAAIAAALLLACAFNFFFTYRVWESVHPEREVNNVTWEAAEDRVGTIRDTANRYEQTDTEQLGRLDRLDELGEATVGSDDGRKLWLELLKTITDCLPVDENLPEGKQLTTIKDRPLGARPEIYIDSIESQYFADLATWNTAAVQEKYAQFLQERRAGLSPDVSQSAKGDAADAGSDDAEGGELPADDTPDDLPEDPGPEFDPLDAAPPEDAPVIEGSGWVIEIEGHHFQRKGRMKDKQYVRKTLMEQLESGKVKVPAGPGGELVEFGVKEMGILSPVLVKGKIDKGVKISNPDYQPPKQDMTAPGAENTFTRNPFNAASGVGAVPKAEEDPDNPRFFYAERYAFVVQFCWKQIPLKARLKARHQQEQAEELARAEQGF